tara:strand:+ start:545 stop:2938 length:2394 start_codon:yes stop_codon:yes gene_type:complete
MGEQVKRFTLVSFMIFIMIIQVFGSVSARSVHSVSDFDLFPQGDFTNPGDWHLDSGVTFLTSNAEYTESMVADNRMTVLHSRPDNFQTLSIWSQNSESGADSSTGQPDSQYNYTSGPVIELDYFDTSSFSSYELVAVSVVVAFHIPDNLEQDQVQFVMNYDGNYENLVTFVNTQGPIDYMNNTIWSNNITSLTQWSWSMIENLEFTLDYVSVGSSDDARLDVDALGIEVVVKYPWYGSEWASAESTFSGHSMPLMNVNLSSGQFDNMALSQCGLTPSISGTSGSWTSGIIQSPPSQIIGRVHYSLQDSGVGDVVMEISSSTDGQSFSSFTIIDNHDLINESYIKIRVTSTDSCITQIKLDLNDFSLNLNGRVFGSLDGLSTSNSRWKAFVNGQEITYQPLAQLGDFNLKLPIGQYIEPTELSITVKIQAWFNWDSTGSASTTAFEISSLSIGGGYDLEWDENPVCESVGPQNFFEDGGGVLIPFLNNCNDDRTSNENLTITFDVEDDSLISADITQGDIRLLLGEEQSGITTVTITVSDESNNQWQDTFVVTVNSVDDPPILNEFPAVVPVELYVSSQVPFSYNDIDSTELTANTNRSWAIINLSTGYITITAPSAGLIVPVEVNLCDQSTCVQRILDLEVQSLADLEIEDIIIAQDEVFQQDIVPVRIYVRNSGDAEASLVSVRCQQGNELIDLQTISILQPGDLGVVTCDWLVPEDLFGTNITVELDRGETIPEGNETNNIKSISVEINEKVESDSSSSSFDFSGSTVWISVIVLIVLLVGMFRLLAPPKIRKIN